MSITPLGDNVFVLPDEPVTATVSGIMLAGTGRSDDPTNPLATCTGVVQAVGPGGYAENDDDGLTFVQPDVRPGDRILFSRFAGMDKQVTLDGRRYRVMREVEIMGVLSGPGDGFGFNELTA